MQRYISVWLVLGVFALPASAQDAAPQDSAGRETSVRETGVRETATSRPAREVFSGPQVGERLMPFAVRYGVGDKVGQEFDLVQMAAGKPVLIIFVHEVTRPSIALVRLIAEYAHRSHESLTTGVIFLSDDATETEAFMKRASHALPQDVPVGISLHGQEGPGPYGLNRKVAVTMLVGNDNRVTANFALVQPSVAADAPRIGKAIVDVLGGGTPPTLADMGADRYGAAAMRMDDRFRSMLSPVIQKTATPEQVDTAAKAVEELAARNPAFQQRLGDTARRIIQAGRLESYGTARAQTYLQKWAKEYGKSSEPEAN